MKNDPHGVYHSVFLGLRVCEPWLMLSLGAARIPSTTQLNTDDPPNLRLLDDASWIHPSLLGSYHTFNGSHSSNLISMCRPHHLELRNICRLLAR